MTEIEQPPLGTADDPNRGPERAACEAKGLREKARVALRACAGHMAKPIESEAFVAAVGPFAALPSTQLGEA